MLYFYGKEIKIKKKLGFMVYKFCRIVVISLSMKFFVKIVYILMLRADNFVK